MKKLKLLTLTLGCLCGAILWQDLVLADEAYYPLLENKTGKTIIQRVTKSDFEIMITSQKGTTIIVDPLGDSEKFINTVKPDIICVTHYDVVDLALMNKFMYDKRCRISTSAESFTKKDVRVIGIRNEPESQGGREIRDVMYIFEVDGLRIAHLGETAQRQLTPEQLAKLGKIDIAFIPFLDYQNITADDYINLTRQLNPQILIPTFNGKNNGQKVKVGEILKLPLENIKNIWVVGKADLEDTGQKIIELTFN